MGFLKGEAIEGLCVDGNDGGLAPKIRATSMVWRNGIGIDSARIWRSDRERETQKRHSRS